MTTPTTTDTNTNTINPPSATDLTSPGPVVDIRNDGQHLAKSNVLRYFESREAVLLELLDRAVRHWVAEVSDELAHAIDPRLPAQERGEQLAAALSRSLARHTVLCDLVGAQAGVLEHNVAAERFWRRHGFAELRRQPYTARSGHASRVIVMSRPLP